MNDDDALDTARHALATICDEVNALRMLLRSAVQREKSMRAAINYMRAQEEEGKA